MDVGISGNSYILVGGTRGMGFAAARVLAADGARLSLIGRDVQQAEAQARSLRSEFSIEAIGLAADCANGEGLEDAVAASVDRLGPPRGLLTSNGSTNRNGDILQMKDADWAFAFQDVLMGQVRACRAVLPIMIANGRGQIVTTAAYSARVPKQVLFGYSAMKAALVNVTKNIAKSHGSSGIRANCICPGAIVTGKFEGRLAAAMEDRGLSRDEAESYIMLEIFKMQTGLGRPGQASEVAEVMAFALSESGAYMTGATINVDGGTDF